jgi:hypothetical protein
MSLTIIIVNYKTPRLLADCLASLYRHTQGIIFDTIVVDNASGDDSEAVVREQFPQVQWMQMGYNAGFARANNAAIRIAGGDAVLLLNSDTIVEDDAIAQCYTLLMRSAYAAAGVQLLNPDRSPQISGNYAMRGGLNYLLPLPFTGAFMKWLGYLLQVKKPNVPEAVRETEVDWINGAFLMVKRTAYSKAGLLDEDFFLYAEEAEWCSRLKKQGPLCIYGQWHIIHLQGESANTSFGSQGKGYYHLHDRKGLQMMLSNFLRIRKQFGAGWYILMLLAYSFEVPLFFLLQFFRNIFSGRQPLRGYQWWRGFVRNMWQLWQFTPRILSGKPYFYKVL